MQENLSGEASPSILLLGDDVEFGSVLKGVFAPHQWSLKRLSSRTLDLEKQILGKGAILLDIQNWKLDASETLQKLDSLDSALPVVVLAGSLADGRQVLEAGAWDVLIKPFKSDQILLAAMKALRERDQRQSRSPGDSSWPDQERESGAAPLPASAAELTGPRRAKAPQWFESFGWAGREGRALEEEEERIGQCLTSQSYFDMRVMLLSCLKERTVPSTVLEQLLSLANAETLSSLGLTMDAVRRYRGDSVTAHCVNVGWVAFRLGGALKWSESRRERLFWAGLFHELAGLEDGAIFSQVGDAPLDILAVRGWVPLALSIHAEAPEQTGQGSSHFEECLVLDLAHQLETQWNHPEEWFQRTLQRVCLKVAGQPDLPAWLATGLLKAFSLFPPGELVRLSDGRIGRVVDLRSNPLKSPIVSVLYDQAGCLLNQPEILELSRQPHLRVLEPLSISDLPQNP